MFENIKGTKDNNDRMFRSTSIGLITFFTERDIFTANPLK